MWPLLLLLVFVEEPEDLVFVFDLEEERAFELLRFLSFDFALAGLATVVAVALVPGAAAEATVASVVVGADMFTNVMI